MIVNYIEAKCDILISRNDCPNCTQSDIETLNKELFSRTDYLTSITGEKYTIELVSPMYLFRPRDNAMDIFATVKIKTLPTEAILYCPDDNDYKTTSKEIIGFIEDNFALLQTDTHLYKSYNFRYFNIYDLTYDDNPEFRRKTRNECDEEDYFKISCNEGDDNTVPVSSIKIDTNGNATVYFDNDFEPLYRSFDKATDSEEFLVVWKKGDVVKNEVTTFKHVIELFIKYCY